MKSVAIFAMFLTSTALADDVVRVTSLDLAAQTHKWDGKTIETQSYCFYADVNEFRCAMPGGARIDFTDLQPDAARAVIEKNCDTISKFMSRPCFIKFRFVYESYGLLDANDGTQLHTVKAKDDIGTILPK